MAQLVLGLVTAGAAVVGTSSTTLSSVPLRPVGPGAAAPRRAGGSPGKAETAANLTAAQEPGKSGAVPTQAVHAIDAGTDGVRPRTASPFAQFVGHLDGASNDIARVLNPSVNVSASEGGDPVMSLSDTSPLGAPRVMLVVRDAGDWIQVLLPIRPNDSLGWVRRDEVEVTTVTYRVEVDRLSHRVQVFNGSEMLLDQAVAVGADSTPTPGGQFFTVELLQPPNAHGAYGPFAFTLSGYSTVYQTFGSGDGAIGMHGTNDSGSIGRSASHGCVRLTNETVSWLAGFLPLGTPVFIS